MKKNKIKYLTITLVAISIFASGIFTVNAMTDGSIVNAVNDIIEKSQTIKVNDKDYNAKCEVVDDKMKCTIDKEEIGDDVEVTVEKVIENTTETDNQLDIEFKTE